MTPEKDQRYVKGSVMFSFICRDVSDIYKNMSDMYKNMSDICKSVSDICKNMSDIYKNMVFPLNDNILR